jgi:undecaprenyl-diphosphatase
VHDRLDPAKATGLALTVGVGSLAVVGTVVGVLAYLVRTKTGLVTGDGSVARWAAVHATPASTRTLRLITQLGSTVTVITLAILVAALDYRRSRSLVALFFLALAGLGQAVIVDLIKFGVDRARPGVTSVAFGPGALFSGASFPSGHSAAAACYYASFALLLARGRSASTRAIMDGIAVAVAVAVASSRVMLRAHWLSDVVAGLAIGWGWFVLCAIAFGGRTLRFGAPVEEATTDS